MLVPYEHATFACICTCTFHLHMCPCAVNLHLPFALKPTLELVRFMIEYGGSCFLDKDKRGDFQVCAPPSGSEVT